MKNLPITRTYLPWLVSEVIVSVDQFIPFYPYVFMVAYYYAESIFLSILLETYSFICLMHTQYF